MDTDLRVHNDNAFDVAQLDGPFVVHVCAGAPCPQPIAARSTGTYDALLRSAAARRGDERVARQRRGVAVRVACARSDAAVGGAGTEIPVVREHELRATAFSLLDVPADAQPAGFPA